MREFFRDTLKFVLIIIISSLLFIIILFEVYNIFLKKKQIIKEVTTIEAPEWVQFQNINLKISTSSEISDDNINFFDFDDNFYKNRIPYEISLFDKQVKILFSDKTNWETNKTQEVQNIIWANVDKKKGNELVILYWENDELYEINQYISVYSFLGGEIKLLNKKRFDNYILDIKQYIDNQILINGLNGVREMLSLDKDNNFIVNLTMFDYDDKVDVVEDKVSINAFGDNLIHSNIYKYGIRNKNDFSFLYEHIKKENENSDLSVINHETMLVKNKNLYSDYPKFGIPTAVGDAIVDAGFDIVTCATNHAIDKEDIGIRDTYDFYKSKNILCLGIHKLNEKRIPYEILEKNNIKFSLFNYTYGTNFGEKYEMKYQCVNTLKNKNQVLRDIKEGREKSDISIVFVHWGIEYNNYITEFQREWAKIFLESGVDIVIGTHPHVLQDVEIMSDDKGNEMLIFYSLGNFISSQNTINTMVGGEAKINILKTNNGYKILYDLIPTITHKEKGFITTYLLSDYNDDLLKKHKLTFDIDDIQKYVFKIINK